MNSIIHNNIGNNILEKQIYKNVLFIDSEFRDYTIYKNPFSFIVKFNGKEPQTNIVQVNISDNIFYYTQYYNGDRCILIDRVFKNIVSITINTLFMPNNIAYETINNDYVPVNTPINKFFSKYIVLKIDEISNEKNFTNNKNLGNNSYIMTYDDISGKYGTWIPVDSTIVYPVSNLKVIDKLTIQVCNDRGDIFYPILDGEQYDFFAEYKTLIDTEKTTPGSVDVNRLQTLKNITQSISPELHITFSILEPQINTQPLFRH